MASLKERVTESLTEPTGSEVIHLRALRKAVGFVAVGLPFALAIGENLRDWILPHAARVDSALVEGSISAYFHTGMREVFVGSLCAIAVFLVCYKGYQRRDNLAANIAGSCALLVALFPTREQSREAADTGVPAIDSATLFSSANAPDPAFVSYVHFSAAVIFFVILAYMSLYLFTISTKANPTPQKLQRNTVYRFCGVTILVCIAVIAIGKFFLNDAVSEQTHYVFVFESIAVIIFGFSWLTKAEVLLADK
jgi:heme A synthase